VSEPLPTGTIWETVSMTESQWMMNGFNAISYEWPPRPSGSFVVVVLAMPVSGFGRAKWKQ
jgi:hypothetical protein